MRLQEDFEKYSEIRAISPACSAPASSTKKSKKNKFNMKKRKGSDDGLVDSSSDSDSEDIEVIS